MEMKSVLWAWAIVGLAHHVTLGSQRPTIGILSQEPNLGVDKLFPDSKSYISASYVKAVESSGARVVPIFIGNTETYYRKLLGEINGVILPGGGASFYNKEEGYIKAVCTIYKIGKEINDQNSMTFPIMAIELGFQALMFAANNNKELRDRCNCFNENLSLDVVPNTQESLLFSRATTSLINLLSTSQILHFWQIFCISSTSFIEHGLHKDWQPLSYNINNRGMKFVSSVEHRQYPFVGIQFLPQNNAYEWKRSQDNPHSALAIQVGRYFFDWLVNHARLNSHHFDTTEEENAASIHNYCPIFTGYTPGIAYEQIYVFPKNNKLYSSIKFNQTSD